MTTQDTVTVVVRFALMMRRQTQAQLAAALGLSQSAVSHRLTGDVRWTVDELDGLAEFFGISVAELVAPPSPMPTSLTAGAVRRGPRRRRTLQPVTFGYPAGRTVTTVRFVA